MFGLTKRTPPRAVAFDIIGTVFPLEPLRRHVVALGLPPAGLELLYATAEREASALALTGDYQPFATLIEQSLSTILAEQHLPVPVDAAAPILAGMATLPAREGAQAAFAELSAAGVTILALTNGGAETTGRMLDGAGLHVSHIVSTDQVKRAKPASAIYLKGAETAGVAPHELTLIAAHPWDLHGASAAGLGTAFLECDRPTVPAFRPPLVSASTLPGMVAALLQG